MEALCCYVGLSGLDVAGALSYATVADEVAYGARVDDVNGRDVGYAAESFCVYDSRYSSYSFGDDVSDGGGKFCVECAVNSGNAYVECCVALLRWHVASVCAYLWWDSFAYSYVCSRDRSLSSSDYSR